MTRDTVSPGAEPGLEMAESSEEMRRGEVWAERGPVPGEGMGGYVVCSEG